jgi:ATP-dependent helicase/DNAse subunit B
MKNIRAVGAPLQVSQAKVLGEELKKLNPSELDKTAVILPEEGLLIPVLHSIPSNIRSLNVTMGFSLKNLQNNKKGKGDSTAYYYNDAIQILQHNYIKFLSAAEIYELINDIKKRNRVYISRKQILSAFKQPVKIISIIFTDITTAKESMDYLYNIILAISDYFESKEAANVFETEYLFKVYTEINRLYDILNRYSTEMDFKTFWKILIEVLTMIKVPFTGEPLKGMQIMGLLETRSLDFENVYILSMNEGIMPKGNVHSSFIPYSLRKAFSLPTYEDEDSTSAYYFYRLIQRAKNVYMIYNTEPGEIYSGEKSRFIMQVENELANENPNIKFESLLFQTEVGIPKRKEITVQKSNEIIELLKNEPHFSATTLANYINCPLQFYFKTVSKLKEEETVDEFFTGAGFGTILHEIMNLIYSDYNGKKVDKKIIDELKNKLTNNYDELWQKACSRIREFEEFKLELSGKNLLQKNIIKKLIEKILDNDLNEAPFKIVDLEKVITKEINVGLNGKTHKVLLYGRLDRIEEKDGILRIIDYKTGQIDKQKLKAKIGLENFSLIFDDSTLKERFQQYLYSYIYSGNNADLKIKLGIYPLRYISEGIVFFEENTIEPGRMALFADKLSEMVKKIFDSTTPFKQTENIDRCRFCAYKSICYRD